MAGSGRNPEEVGERGKADATQAALEQATGERRRAERRLGEASSLQPEQLPLEKALVEAGVLRDEEPVTGEAEEAAKNAGDGGRLPKLLLAQAGEAGDGLREHNSRID